MYEFNLNHPPIGVEIIAQDDRWIDEDYNPLGIRFGFLNENEDGPFICVKYDNNQDYYETLELHGSDRPRFWKHISI